MSRAHLAILSLLLGLATCAGAVAVLSTSALGQPASKPEVAAAAAIVKRERALDRWEASLDRALVSRPPALPPLPRYPGIVLVGARAGGALPEPVAPPASKAVPARVATVKTTDARATVRPAKPATGGRTIRNEDDKPTMPTTPVAPPTAPAVAAAPVVIPAQAAPPASEPKPASGESAKRSAEQQCEALKQAAEGKGEAAKQAAERQCEALKNAAEGD